MNPPNYLKMKNENIFVRDIDWEVNFVLSSKYVSVLDEALVTIHLSNKEYEFFLLSIDLSLNIKN